MLHEPGRRPQQGRFQYVLDYSNPAVVDWIFGAAVQRAGRRADRLHQVGHEPQHQRRLFLHGGQRCQGMVLHNVHPGGVPAVPGCWTERYPHILFESCASGGARFDPGMLGLTRPSAGPATTPTRWERLRIQYGTSFVYPVSSMGAHVAATPNHQVGRITSSDHAGQRGHFRGLWL